jgi:predicted adenine nucleotide alpha hydrolase (AANH) superfamily ATPase
MDNNTRPKLLLHACCAPCSSHALEYLAQTYDINLYFYNPNIEPQDEYNLRLSELKRLAKEMPLPLKITVTEGEYDNAAWQKELQTLPPGYENEKEGGNRCKLCIKHRLEKTAEQAKQIYADYFSTTLTVSPHKNAEYINETALELAKKYDTQALPLNLKKQNGYKRSIELSKIYKLYRQNYCGCVFGKNAQRAANERGENEEPKNG